MDQKTFNQIVENQKEDCYATLIAKEKEYSDGKDRLIQFKNVAAMRNVHPLEALAGMMVKHTSSIYEMIDTVKYGGFPPMEKWDEKITDHINYLFLLKALVLDMGSYYKMYKPLVSPDVTDLGAALRSGEPSAGDHRETPNESVSEISKSLEEHNPYEDDKTDPA